MQVKITMSYNLILLRMTIKKKKTDSKCWQGCGNSYTLLWECKMAKMLLQKTIWILLKQLKLEVPYDPANLLLGVYPKEQKSESQRDISVPSYTVALFMLIKMQDLNRLKCPLIYEWIEIWYIYIHIYTHTHNGVLFYLKKEYYSTLFFLRWNVILP